MENRVNFTCQLDWVIWYPDMQSNIIVGISVRVILDGINI